MSLRVAPPGNGYATPGVPVALLPSFAPQGLHPVGVNANRNVIASFETGLRSAAWAPPIATAFDSPRCVCCLSVPCIGLKGLQSAGDCATVPVFADPGEIGEVTSDEVQTALLRVFGKQGVEQLFGAGADGDARLVKNTGLNHVFMVALAGRLAKCVRPMRRCAPHLSEALQAERLRMEAPGLASDCHAVFPLGVFQCEEVEQSDAIPCEILVFEYLEDCRSVGDLLHTFERTHPGGQYQGLSVCHAYRCTGTCEHLAALRALVGRQAARLGVRFQARHGRRHGDFKANNLLIDVTGIPKLADFLSPFCRTCDREEFFGSVTSTHPAIQEMRSLFDGSWRSDQLRGSILATMDCAIHSAEIDRNAWLLKDLCRLSAGLRDCEQTADMTVDKPSVPRSMRNQLPFSIASARSRDTVSNPVISQSFSGRGCFDDSDDDGAVSWNSSSLIATSKAKHCDDKLFNACRFALC